MRGVILGFLIAPGALAQEAESVLSEIVVRSTRWEAVAGTQGRSWEWVSEDEIARARPASLSELLERLTGATISERGDWAVQADLSAPGGTFQQTLLAFDGLPLSDPQTAHHNLNAPFLPQDVRGVAVINGPNSAVYGPGAFAGVVNLLPRVPLRSGGWVSASAGSLSTRRAAGSADSVGRMHRISTSGSYAASDGFRAGTDYDIWSVWSSAVLEKDRASIRLSAGRTEKDFGAADFYAPYPSREQIAASLLDVAPAFDMGGGWLLKGIARWRRHEDTFVLIASNPSFYRNEHISDTFAERVTVRSPVEHPLSVEMGAERSDARLSSSSLGGRSAWSHAGFALVRLTAADRWIADLAARVDDHEQWGTEWTPSLALSRRLGDEMALRAAVARGIRPPSWTELYYEDPRNKGKEDLEPETCWGFEGGADALAGPMKASLTVFRRDARQVIDWVRENPDQPWRAANVSRLDTQGIETRLGFNRGRLGGAAFYRYTDSDAERGGFQSKYALHVARHETGVKLAWTAARCDLSVDARYADIPTLSTRCVVSGTARYRVHRSVGLVVAGRNLTNRRYEEIPDVPAPPRTVEGGVEVLW